MELFCETLLYIEFSMFFLVYGLEQVNTKTCIISKIIKALQCQLWLMRNLCARDMYTITEKKAGYEIDLPITTIYLIWGGINKMTVQRSVVEAFL